MIVIGPSSPPHGPTTTTPPRMFSTLSRHAVAAALGLFLIGNLSAQSETSVLKAGSLSSASAWSLEDSATAQLLDWPGAVALDLKLEPNKSAVLLLKEPVAIPAGANNLTLTLGTGDWSGDSAFRFRVLVTDSRGAEYAYKASSPLIQSRENYFFPSHQSTWTPLRLSIPGLKRPVVGEGVDERNYSVEVRKKPASGPALPQHPLTLRGLEFTGTRPGATKVYANDFVFSQVSPKTSRLHYLVDKHERFGEVDGLPFVTLGGLGPSYGATYDLVWTLRDRFEGRPFASGAQTIEVDPADPARALNLATRIVFPVEEQGVYWASVRRIWKNKADSPVPDRIDTYEFRIDVLSGKPAVTRTPLAGPIPGMAVNIGSDRHSFIFGEKEMPTLSVAFSPAASIASPGYRITAIATGSGETLKTWENTLPASASHVIDVDLSGLSAGAVRLQADLLSNGRPMDRAEQLVGLPPKTSAQTKPDPSADWRKFSKDKALIYVGMSKGPLKDPATRVAKVKQLLDEANAVSNVIEYEFNWAHIEPMPGVFDWSEVDAIVDYAKQKGQTVLLWPTFIGGEPDWIPPHFQRLADGTVSGTRSYLFQGGRMNYWHSPELKEQILRLCKAMVLRYRGNPTVHGYYLLVEHGGDNPWYAFFPGYETETIADYQSYLKTKYKSPGATASAWGRPLSGWDAVSVPEPDASDRERLDWNQFRSDRLGDFFIHAVREIRALDPYKLVMVYTGAADGDSAIELEKLGVILADGGAASPITGGPGTMGYAAAGLGRRTEEISVTSWTAQFPTQLDATLFNLTLGGGRNANAKMFFTPGKPLAELRVPKFGLDRFEQFIPIWSELAPTEPMPWEAYMLKDVAGSMLASKSTTGLTDAFTNMVPFDSHVLTPAVPMSIAKQGRLIFLQPRFASYEVGTHDELAAYVRSGGTLILTAGAARFSPDLPGEDWVLLKRLGITPPSEIARTGTLAAKSAGGVFNLRDAWRAPSSDAEVLATFETSGAPALTRHRIGKGVVNVIWSNSILPPTEGGGYPFFRDIADAAGVTRHSDASIPQLWTNLLRNPQSGDHYGTVYHAAWFKTNAPALTGATLWKIPPGDYAVTELISGRELGVKSAAALAASGVETTLGPREVAVYRFKKQ